MSNIDKLTWTALRERVQYRAVVVGVDGEVMLSLGTTTPWLDDKGKALAMLGEGAVRPGERVALQVFTETTTTTSEVVEVE